MEQTYKTFQGRQEFRKTNNIDFLCARCGSGGIENIFLNLISFSLAQSKTEFIIIIISIQPAWPQDTDKDWVLEDYFKIMR